MNKPVKIKILKSVSIPNGQLSGVQTVIVLNSNHESCKMIFIGSGKPLTKTLWFDEFEFIY